MNKVKQFGSSILPSICIICVLLLGMFFVSHRNYMLFHCLAELFSIVVAVSIFMITWNVREILENNYLLFIGIAYLFVAAFDLLHTLSYTGMGVITGYGTDLPTQLWIISRYLESAALLLGLLFLNRRLHVVGEIITLTLLSAFLLIAILKWSIFPNCFVEGQGLTLFKIISEYVICLLLILSGILLFKSQANMERQVVWLLMGSIFVTILSELSFTLYMTPFGIMNKIGHLLKILSFYLIYKAILEAGLKKPYTLLFRRLQKRESDLAISQERFRMAVNHYPHMFVIYDAERRIQYINTFGAGLCGKNQSEIIGHLDEEINPPEMTASYLPLLNRAIKTRKPQSKECVIKIAARVFNFIVTYVPVLNAAGDITQVLGATQDLTEQKRTAAAHERLHAKIREQNIFLENLLNDAPVGVAVIQGTEHRFELVNKYYQQIPGTSSPKMLGQTFSQVFPQAAEAGATDFFDRVYQSRKTVSLREYEVSVGPGRESTFWNVELVPLFDGDVVNRVLIIVIEMTELIMAKKSAEAQVARDTALMRFMHEGLLIIDMKTKTIEMNPAAEAMFRKNSGFVDVVSMESINKAFIFRTLEGEILPDKRQPLNRVMRGESFLKDELYAIAVEGGNHWTASFNGTPIFDGNGHQIFSLLTVRDITEEKEAEKSLRFSRDELEKEVEERTRQLIKANQELEEFTYIASHDLQEPLRKIQSFSDRLLALYSDRLEKKGSDYINRMHNAARRMRLLINDLLFYSRVSTTKAVFSTMDLTQVLKNVMDDLDDMVKRCSGRVVIENLGTIEADPQQMHQLFQNLIQNGLKFNDQDEPAVSVRGRILNEHHSTSCSAVTSWYRIIVEDNGIGMENDVLEEILKPFQRLHSTAKYEGTGIGLAICFKIINCHGGRMKIESKPDHGTTFIVDLPIQQNEGRDA